VGICEFQCFYCVSCSLGRQQRLKPFAPSRPGIHFSPRGVDRFSMSEGFTSFLPEGVCAMRRPIRWENSICFGLFILFSMGPPLYDPIPGSGPLVVGLGFRVPYLFFPFSFRELSPMGPGKFLRPQFYIWVFTLVFFHFVPGLLPPPWVTVGTPNATLLCLIVTFAFPFYWFHIPPATAVSLLLRFSCFASPPHGFFPHRPLLQGGVFLTPEGPQLLFFVRCQTHRFFRFS